MTSGASRLSSELAELLPAHLHGLCASATYPKGTRLFETGQRPVSMFFIGIGEVTLERPGIHGEPLVLQRTRRGFVGEASLQSARYHCDAKVVADSEIAKIPVRELRDAMETDPAFAMRWISMLNREVKQLRLQCERLMLKTVEARLLHLIETEGDGDGYPLGAGLKSMAGELGVTHEALYRCVASLEKCGILRRSGGRMCRVPGNSVGGPPPLAERTRQPAVDMHSVRRDTFRST